MHKKPLSASSFLFSIEFYQDFMYQLPGLIVCKTINSEFLWCNFQGANQMGFKDPKETIGIKDDQIRCPASECADAFVEKDKAALLGNEIELIDINTWANNKRMISYTRKKIFHYLDYGVEKKGIILYSTEITDTMISKLSDLFDDNVFKKEIGNKKSVCYEIKNCFLFSNLTSRESQCFFLLSRGYSAKAIGKILHISHRTVENHIDNIKLKLNIHSKSEIIEYAYSSGLLATIPKSLLINSIFSNKVY